MRELEVNGVGERILYLAFTRCMSARAISRKMDDDVGIKISHSTVSRFLKKNRFQMAKYQSPPYYVKPIPGERVMRYE